MSPTHEPDQMSPAHLRRPFYCRIYLVAAFDRELGLSGRSRGRGGAIWEGAALGSLSCAWRTASKRSLSVLLPAPLRRLLLCSFSIWMPFRIVMNNCSSFQGSLSRAATCPDSWRPLMPTPKVVRITAVNDV